MRSYDSLAPWPGSVATRYTVVYATYQRSRAALERAVRHAVDWLLSGGFEPDLACAIVVRHARQNPARSGDAVALSALVAAWAQEAARMWIIAE